MIKKLYSTRTNYYQTARFFRNSTTNQFAYCLEPFTFFSKTTYYSPTNTPRNLTEEQKDRISKIAYFGYGYQNHIEEKWYAITQLMIWKIANPTDGEYYFTDTLNGNRINIYEEEMQEINNLVDSYQETPAIANQTYTIVEGQTLTLVDPALSEFQIKEGNATISGNSFQTTALEEGEYTYIITNKNRIYEEPMIFYQADNTQSLLQIGNLETKESTIKVNVIKTSLEISKIDKDTQSTIPSGKASLDGAIYQLYDQKMNEIQTFTIENNQILIRNVNFGTYYLKEIKPGVGYTLNETIYEINISEQENKIELIVENTVIKKKITIKKEYGEGNNFDKEKNISFQIIDENKNIIDTITTDEFGIAEITLPYGTYQLIQLTSTTGYSKVDPILITVDNQEQETIELKDYRISVPDTHTEEKYKWFILKMITVLLWII